MTNKEQVFDKIDWNQVHHLWDFLIRKWWQPQFSHFQDTSVFSVWSGNIWYEFNDPTLPENATELRFNMSMPLDNQEERVYDFLLKFLDQV